MTKKLLFFLLGYFFTALGQAQQIQGQLMATDNGYHIIPIPEAFRALLGNDVGMLRLKNENGREIPYVLKKLPESKINFKSAQYKRVLSDSSEQIIIENPNREEWQSISFRIANTNVKKRYTLAGSNDLQRWFSIESYGVLSDLNAINQTTSIKSISFPLNDYKYLRFIFDNTRTAPINILEIGFITNEKIKSTLEQLHTLKSTIVNDPRTKSTIILFTKPNRLPVDHIQFHITTPKQYYRQAKIFNILKNTTNQQAQQNQTAYFTLTERNLTGQPITNNYSETFCIVIANEDNAPLQIDSISAYQLPIEIIADLTAGSSYVLEADNNWHAPNYDLAMINMELPSHIPIANVTQIKSLAVKVPQKTEPEEKEENSRTLLIVCSIIGVAIAFYFGHSLLKDLRKE
ncbi:DUF3999 family protein [Sphingobacterium sp. MYb382]|uniref:DUF3999 family protein n=1 Tax=Sphingobacterium sp. MYb382 TaxID=2745278 RepID=UPI00309AD786